MTLTRIHTQLLKDKYPAEPIYFLIVGWRAAAAVVRAEERGTSALQIECPCERQRITGWFLLFHSGVSMCCKAILKAKPE